MVTGGTDDEILRYIVLAPLVAAILHGFLLVLVRRPVAHWLTVVISCAAATVSFALSGLAFWRLLRLEGESPLLIDNLFTWIGAGVGNHAFSTELAYQFDPLSSAATLVVTGVGLLIHFYSIGFMEVDERDDRGFQRYFCYLNLFLFAMLTLVLADNLVMLFLGWEAVGLCAWLSIGFWYSDVSNARAARRAFIVGRIGDFAFVLGMLLLFSMLAESGHPTVGFQDIERYFAQVTDKHVLVPGWLPWGPAWRLVDVAAFCLFIGACSRSAQLPLHVWLPDSTAAPAPLSAMIQAAAMVGAGVYMCCRMSFLFAAAPEASNWIAWTGATTAALGALFAIVQTDIKRVLAYSTMSQVGLMFVAIGCGAYSVAMFHFATHAYVKALLILAAGSVILAMEGDADMDSMGGLRRSLPRTRWTFLVGVIAIAGLPPLTGMLSRDQVMSALYASQVPGREWWLGLLLVTVGLTSFHMFRLYFRIFRGQSQVPRDRREQMEDPPESMIIPLYLLAFVAAFGGLAGLPQAWGDLSLIAIEGSDSFGNFLAPVLADVEPPSPEAVPVFTLAARSALVGFAGALTAWLFYVGRPNWRAGLEQPFHGVGRALARGFWLDEIYTVFVTRPLRVFSRWVLHRGLDRGLIDGLLIGGTARGLRALTQNGLRHVQSGHVQAYLFVGFTGAVVLVAYLLR